MINKAVFKNKLAPFNDIKIKKIYKDKSKKFCYGQVTTWVWERKGTQQFWLEMLPEYRSKKDFVDTLGHEMVHLYQMANVGDTGNHIEDTKDNNDDIRPVKKKEIYYEKGERVRPLY